MRAGGVRRLELAGERPELGWDRDRSNRRAGSVPRQQLSASGKALPLLLSKQLCCVAHVLLSPVCAVHMVHIRVL